MEEDEDRVLNFDNRKEGNLDLDEGLKKEFHFHIQSIY